MFDFKGIITGWFNLAIGKNRMLRAKRMRICKACPKNIGGFCAECGCFLKAKTSDPEELCPRSQIIHKLNTKNPFEILDFISIKYPYYSDTFYYHNKQLLSNNDDVDIYFDPIHAVLEIRDKRWGPHVIEQLKKK